MVHSPNDALQSHKVSGRYSPRGRVGRQKSLKNPENPDKLSPGRGGEYWGGRPLWDNAAYLRHHRQDIAQTFMVDSPSDALQTHKVSHRNLPRGRASGQKRLQNPQKVMKSCLSKAPGQALARTGAERGRGTIEPQNHQEESRWPCACAPTPHRSGVCGLPRTCTDRPCGCRRLPPRGRCARTFGTAPSGPGTHATGAPAVHTRSRGQRVPAVAVPAEAAVAVTAVVAIQVEVAEVAAKNPKI